MTDTQHTPEAITHLTDLSALPTGTLLTEDEVATYLRISRETLRTWRGRHKGPTVTRVVSLIRYQAGDLLAWLQAS